MASLLLVEDDGNLREAIRSSLTKYHEVTEAVDGRQAKNLISVNQYDLVISDVQMPFVNGVELLEWCNNNHPAPFILMTGFSHLLETQSAHDLGAKEFLTKPFRNNELIEAIDNVLGLSKEAEQEEVDLDEQFCKVSINEFVAQPSIQFDVYIRLSKKKYVKIGHAGSELPRDKIEKYKSNGVEHLFLTKEDFPLLIRFNLKLGSLLKTNRDIDPDKKVNFMKYTGEVILERAFVEGVDKESFNDAKEFIGLAVATITENADFFDLLEMLNSHSDDIYAHSIGVSMYSIMIARRLGLESQNTFLKLSMAGMFHDIGKKEIEREILEKPRPLLSLQERKIVESHPTRSRDILVHVPNVPDDVIQLAFEHHEDCAGQGFPQGLDHLRMHPLSKILQLANIFVDKTVAHGSTQPQEPAVAIEYIEFNLSDRVDHKCLRALKSLFQVSLAERKKSRNKNAS